MVNIMGRRGAWKPWLVGVEADHAMTITPDILFLDRRDVDSEKSYS